jgi:FAD/FMN-containing dehydrogenase
VLIELASGATTAETGLDLEQALATFLEERFELLEDAVLGRGYDLWRLRHAISEGVRAIGPTIAFDISVPRSRILAFRQAARSWLAAEHPAITVFDFGHLADGGLHFNLVGKPAGATTVPQLREQLYDLVVREFGGSFSAEHGVGSHNLASWRRHTPAAAQALAGRLQDLLDPNRLCASVDFRGPAIETPAP